MIPAIDERSVDTPDSELLRRFAKAGDRAALGLLFERHAPTAYRVALRVTRNSADAEESVQMAFVNVMRKAHLYRGEEAGVKAWLMKIVVNACKMMILKNTRRRKREETFCEDSAGQREGDHEVRVRERMETVKRALERLSDKYRLPLWLHHYEGLSFRDVAPCRGPRLERIGLQGNHANSVADGSSFAVLSLALEIDLLYSRR